MNTIIKLESLVLFYGLGNATGETLFAKTESFSFCFFIQARPDPYSVYSVSMFTSFPIYIKILELSIKANKVNIALLIYPDSEAGHDFLNFVSKSVFLAVREMQE